MRSLTPALVGGLLAATTLIAAGPLACTACDLDGCADLLRIRITEPGGGQLLDGEYAFNIVTDLAQYEGTCTVSESAQRIVCPDLGNIVSAPRFGSPDAPHETFWIDFPDWSQADGASAPLPQSVELSLTFEGTPVVDESLRPDYKVADKTCHPDCLSDSIALSMSR